MRRARLGPVSGWRRGIRWVALAGLIGGLGALGWATLVEPDRLVVVEETVHLTGASRAVDGLRVAVIGDVHLGAPFIDAAKVERVVERANTARPDLVALVKNFVATGVVGGRSVAPSDLTPIFSKLRAPLGVYAVLGNH